ncbi:MAG: hypothetical protein ACR2HE_10730 [Casimicrobiaceae bacterium]
MALPRLAAPLRAAIIVATVFLVAPWALANPPETVLVRRGDVVITQADYDAEIEKLPSHLRAGFALYERKVVEMLDRLLVARELGARARARGLIKASELAGRSPLESDRVLAAAWIAYVDEQAGRAFDAKRRQWEERARELYLVDKSRYAGDGGNRSFEEAKETILADLRRREQTQARAAEYALLRERNADVEINAAALRLLKPEITDAAPHSHGDSAKPAN